MQSTAAASIASLHAPAGIRTPRHEMFNAIHKGLRRCLAETLVDVGRADADDAAVVAATLASVRELVAFCRMHMHAENQFVRPAMEARRPGSSLAAAAEQVNHEAELERLEADARVLERGARLDRATALAALYQRLALFVAGQYEHMSQEEARHQPVLWAEYTDDELRAIQGAMLASQSAETRAVEIRWTLQAASLAECLALLSSMRGGTPSGALQEWLAFAISVRGEDDGTKLRSAVQSNPSDVTTIDASNRS